MSNTTVALAMKAAQAKSEENAESVIDGKPDHDIAPPSVAPEAIPVLLNRAFFDEHDSRMVELLEQLTDSNAISTINDLHLVASLVETEYDRIPAFNDIARAVQAATSPDAFAFDRDTVTRVEVDGDVMQAGMTPSEIASKRRDGFKPLGNTQYMLLCEVGERALTGIAHAKALKERGFSSQHNQQELWQMASERAKKRQAAYKNMQELEQHRDKAKTDVALTSLTASGGMLDW